MEAVATGQYASHGDWGHHAAPRNVEMLTRGELQKVVQRGDVACRPWAAAHRRANRPPSPAQEMVVSRRRAGAPGRRGRRDHLRTPIGSSPASMAAPWKPPQWRPTATGSTLTRRGLWGRCCHRGSLEDGRIEARDGVALAIESPGPRW